MKVAIFDPFNGAAGDMIISTLLQSALSRSDLEEVVKSLDLNIDFEISDVVVKGIKAKKLIVTEREANERRYREVVELIRKAEIDEGIKSDALKIFRILAEAEGKVHGRSFEDAVFHEVGSDDAVFDIVCSAMGFRRLAEKGYSSYSMPILTGRGFVEFSHGRYPVPAPAVMEILRNSELKVIFDGEGELLTPTGAAILSYYCKNLPAVSVKVEGVYYGAGSRETEVPNLLRLILGKAQLHDSISVIETTIDDVSGEMVGYAVEKLLEVDGVLDVSIIPAFGKKMRPSSIIRVISEMEKAEDVAAEVMKATGSLGVRIFPVHHRAIAERWIGSVKVRIAGREFEVRFKRSSPEFRHVKPEFDDVARIADETNLPVHVVYRKVMKVLEDADTERE